MCNQLPNANDRVRVIATGDLGTIDHNGAPIQTSDGAWQFFVRLDLDAGDRRWRGWWRADELEIVGQ